MFVNITKAYEKDYIFRKNVDVRIERKGCRIPTFRTKKSAQEFLIAIGWSKGIVSIAKINRRFESVYIVAQEISNSNGFVNLRFPADSGRAFFDLTAKEVK